MWAFLKTTTPVEWWNELMVPLLFILMLAGMAAGSYILWSS